MAKRIVGILVAVIVVAAGIGVYLAFSSSKPPPSAVVPKAQRDAAEHRLAEALAAPAPAAGSPHATSDKPRSASLHFHEDDVDTVLASDPAVQAQLKQHGVQAMQVSFEEPDLVRLDAWVGVKGASHEVDLEGALTPNGHGGLQFHTDKTQVGLLDIPAGISSDQIDREIAGYLATVQPKLPIDVQSVTVVNGEITLSGVKRARS